ncbi:hypothetical protein F8M41_018531 [Gigaspora margarita]|uniref:Uncharacterized protein n=1 Tax=Gigaspora margarita TaxID=4874 RepID=A0A8H4ELA2_GIGMA|nr:hypothetical protein F8M41_018531 [Gigaspora margarita]
MKHDKSTMTKPMTSILTKPDINSWTQTNEMLNFFTKIHKDNLLAKTARTNILKEQPRNAEIKYEAPTMDKRIWKLMSPQAKETDKLLSKIAYRSSATLRPLDNTLRAIYDRKPDNDMKLYKHGIMLKLLLKTQGPAYWTPCHISTTLEGNNPSKLFYLNTHHPQEKRKYSVTTLNQSSKKKTLQINSLTRQQKVVRNNNIITKKAVTNLHMSKVIPFWPWAKGQLLLPLQSYAKTGKRVSGRPQLHGSPKTIQQPKLDDKLRREQTPVAERLLSHLINWTKLTGPSWHTYIIKEGYCPEWIVTPPLNYYSPDLHHVVAPDLSGEIQNLLEKRIIEEIT